MEFRVLGTLEVIDNSGNPVEIHGAKLRRLLAMLLLRAGQTVSVDALADVLWGDQQPSGSANALQAQVSKLRKLLADVALVTRDGGYALDLAAARIDAEQFPIMVDTGSELLRNGRPADAAAELRRALAMWRGPAFADFMFDAFAEADRVRLDELRLAAQEVCVDAELAGGHHDLLVPELERLVAQHPLRERMWEQLMMALYRGGRQSDALRAFQRAREVLAEQLGLEPGPGLRELEQRILDHDVAIAPTIRPASAERLSNVEAELTSFVGRDAVLADLEATLAERRLVTITGPGGVGKTRTAIEVALRSAARWRDGTWLVELGLEQGPGGVARSFLRTFGPRLGRTDPEAGMQWLLDGLANTELLIIVDNCEHLVTDTSMLVGNLVRACPAVRVLATSREPLNARGEVVRRLAPLSMDDAVALFASRAADSSETFALDADTTASIELICGRVDRLPLAIELTAARTRAFSPSQLAELLARRLRVVAADNQARPARQQSLHATVEWSVDLLFEDERRLLARLCVFTGGFTLDGAVAVCADDLLPAEDIELVLARLVDKSLVTPITPVMGATRFRLLRPVAEFCAVLLDAAGETATMRSRHARWVVQLTSGLTAGLRSAAKYEWTRLVHDELANITAGARWCRSDGDPVDGLRIGVNLGWYAFLSADIQADEPLLLDLIERAVDAPPALRCRGEIWAALLSIGRTGRRTWAMDAIDVARTAAGTPEPSDDLPGEYRLVTLDGAALTYHSIALARAEGDDRVLLEALTIGSLHLAAIGSLPQDLKPLNDEARALAIRLDDTWSTAFVVGLDGLATYVAGELAESMGLIATAIDSLMQLGDEGTAALFEVSLSEVAELAGDIPAATRAMATALYVGSTAGFRSAAILRSVLCWLAARNGELERAIALGREAVAASRQPFNPVIRAQALFALGVAEFRTGDLAAARSLLAEALEVHQQAGMVREAAMDHRHLGELCRAEGDFRAALEHGRVSLEGAVAVGLPWTIMLCARTFACSLVQSRLPEDAEFACRLVGVAEGVSSLFGYAPTDAERAEIDLARDGARAVLGDEIVDSLIAAASDVHFANVLER